MITRIQTSLDNLVGKRVRVYRNLNNDCFSVLYNGLVVAHVDSITLKNAIFKVQETGRQRVIKEKRKNVHAFVEGEVILDNLSLKEEVSYNPYYKNSFYKVQTKENILYSPFVYFVKNKAFI